MMDRAIGYFEPALESQREGLRDGLYNASIASRVGLVGKQQPSSQNLKFSSVAWFQRFAPRASTDARRRGAAE